MKEGQFVINLGEEPIRVLPGEAVIIKKAHRIQYEKIGLSNDKGFECLFIFLKDEFLKEFLRMKQMMKSPHPISLPIISVRVSKVMQGFVQSLAPYFDSQESFHPDLLRLKMLEMLFSLSETNKYLLDQLIEFAHPVRHDLVKVMEENFNKNISLEEFAYLSGRSLSGFKREFQKIFHLSPGKWLKKRRLQHARFLMEHTHMSLSEICFEAGFENFSHFSRSFKEYFKVTPSEMTA